MREWRARTRGGKAHGMSKRNRQRNAPNKRHVFPSEAFIDADGEWNPVGQTQIRQVRADTQALIEALVPAKEWAAEHAAQIRRLSLNWWRRLFRHTRVYMRLNAAVFRDVLVPGGPDDHEVSARLAVLHEATTEAFYERWAAAPVEPRHVAYMVALLGHALHFIGGIAHGGDVELGKLLMQAARDAKRQAQERGDERGAEDAQRLIERLEHVDRVKRRNAYTVTTASGLTNRLARNRARRWPSVTVAPGGEDAAVDRGVSGDVALLENGMRELGDELVSQIGEAVATHGGILPEHYWHQDPPPAGDTAEQRVARERKELEDDDPDLSSVLKGRAQNVKFKSIAADNDRSPHFPHVPVHEAGEVGPARGEPTVEWLIDIESDRDGKCDAWLRELLANASTDARRAVVRAVLAQLDQHGIDDDRLALNGAAIALRDDVGVRSVQRAIVWFRAVLEERRDALNQDSA